ncbi:MAG TPA: hypothetical protein PLR67_02715, partial [Candidatus Dojkabacteria bacterium]|nr:hypothetical protein [Candidatus Dojkabacteria bacterium]
TKTFSSAVVLSTAGTATTHAVRADRTISTTNGITGGGNLTANRTLSLDSTVVRTTGDQTLAGTKTFSSPVVVATPTGATHAATKGYVDSMFSGSGPWTLSGSNVYVTNTAHNVGIGTSSPSTKLHVNGDFSYSGVMMTQYTWSPMSISTDYYIFRTNGLTNGSQAWAEVTVYDNYHHIYKKFEVLVRNEGGTNITSIQPISGTSSDSAIYLKYGNSASNLGVTEFYLRSDSTMSFAQAATISGYNINFSTPVGDSSLASNTLGNHINIVSSGNVGIGTTSPSYNLDVSGTGRFTSTVV